MTKDNDKFVAGYNAGFAAAQDTVMDKLATLAQAVEDRDAEIQRLTEQHKDDLAYWADIHEAHIQRMKRRRRDATEHIKAEARRWKSAYTKASEDLEHLRSCVPAIARFVGTFSKPQEKP